jgi:predicted MFS family arabinose efflux permease
MVYSYVDLFLTLPSIFVVLGTPVRSIFIDRSGRKPILLMSTGRYEFDLDGNDFRRNS